jgi:ABC-type transport system involved in multi-copper enzyme maturation permease subunit
MTNNSMSGQQPVQPKSGFLHWIWQQRPQLINNPVIIREVIDLLRKKSSFIILAITLTVGIFFIIFSWRNLLDVFSRVGYDHWRVSREFFTVMNLVIGSAIFFLTPLFSATCINLERERNTWELLITTPLNILSILWAKIVSCVFFLWILVISLIPIYGLFFTLGGISPQEIYFMMWIFTEILVVTVLVGIACSIWINKSIQAITSTYFILLFLFCVLPFLSIAYTEWYKSPFLLGVPFLLSPLIISLSYFGSTPPPRYYHSIICPDIYYTHGVLIVLFIILILIFCAVGLYITRPKTVVAFIQPIINRFRKNNSIQPLTDKHTISNRIRVCIPMQLLSNWINPIFSKEMRILCGRRYRKIIRAMIISFALSLIIPFGFYIGRWRFDEFIEGWKIVVPWISMILTPLIIIPYAVNCFCYEKDKETWNLLSSTTMKPWSILNGKYLAGFTYYQVVFWIYYTVSITTIIISILISRVLNVHENFHISILMWAIYLCQISLVFLLSFGGWVSLRSRKTLTAYAGIFMSMIVVYLILPIVLKLCYQNKISVGDYSNNNFDNYITVLCSISSPFFLLAEYTDLSFMNRQYNEQITIVTTVMIWHFILYSLISALFIYLTIRHLRRGLCNE